METDELVLYYPQGSRADVLRVAARLEYCRREVQRLAMLKGGLAADKSTFVLPRLPLNNAYVQPRLGGTEQVSVLPTYHTVNLFIAYGSPPDPANIGCHEMVHDQSLRQISGLAAILNRVFGDAYSPQLGLDAWWHEGLAVYYETKLQGTGRLWTKYFDGLFAAGMQEVSTLNGGYLSFQQRGVAAGAAYLVGAHFVDYLARAHGERRLWQVIAEQSDAWGFPFAISNEFRRVYDRSRGVTPSRSLGAPGRCSVHPAARTCSRWEAAARTCCRSRATVPPRRTAARGSCLRVCASSNACAGSRIGRCSRGTLCSATPRTPIRSSSTGVRPPPSGCRRPVRAAAEPRPVLRGGVPPGSGPTARDGGGRLARARGEPLDRAAVHRAPGRAPPELR